MTVHWDQKYADATQPGAPSAILIDNQQLLPISGQALDLACGLGADAMFLAAKGLETHAWDASQVAIEALRAFAKKRKLVIKATVRDVILNPPEPGCWDVILVSHFLDRKLCKHIHNALKPGGLLYYQTFCRSRVPGKGPANPDYLLLENELLVLFSGLIIRYYREYGMLGNLKPDHVNKAFLVAQKPSAD